MAERDEAVLLALLNSTPTSDGVRLDPFDEDDSAQAWLAEHDLDVPVADREMLRGGRDLLQAVARGQQTPAALTVMLDGVVSRPGFAGDDLIWTLGLDGGGDLTGGRAVLVPAALALVRLHVTRPGRLRPCANDECTLFLLDRSKTNSARWCSMAVCGNRLKARRHHERTRQNG
jgi:predicted RNA-binding Zn ribbon-like protein